MRGDLRVDNHPHINFIVLRERLGEIRKEVTDGSSRQNCAKPYQSARNIRMKYFLTSDIARAGGVHPNTVRRYLELGLLPPAKRTANGYRRYMQKHVDCIRLVRMIFTAPYTGKGFRTSAGKIIQRAAADDWEGALRQGYAHLALVEGEQHQAETAVAMLETWASGAAVEPTSAIIQIGHAAELLGISIDMLRNWERNGLIAIPRDARNGYRAYGPAEISRLRIIRLLSRAGYSQMAILRMLRQLDRGDNTNLRHSLDTPAPDEDVYTASDRWLSALAGQHNLVQRVIGFLEQVIRTRTAHKAPRR